MIGKTSFSKRRLMLIHTSQSLMAFGDSAAIFDGCYFCSLACFSLYIFGLFCMCFGLFFLLFFGSIVHDDWSSAHSMTALLITFVFIDISCLFAYNVSLFCCIIIHVFIYGLWGILLSMSDCFSKLFLMECS